MCRARRFASSATRSDSLCHSSALVQVEKWAWLGSDTASLTGVAVRAVPTMGILKILHGARCEPSDGSKCWVTAGKEMLWTAAAMPARHERGVEGLTVDGPMALHSEHENVQERLNRDVSSHVNGDGLSWKNVGDPRFPCCRPPIVPSMAVMQQPGRLSGVNRLWQSGQE